MCSQQMKGKLNTLHLSLVATDAYLLRFCIDNGIMIAQAGLLSYRMGFRTSLEESTCTQRLMVSTRSLTLLTFNQDFARMRCMCRGEHEWNTLVTYTVPYLDVNIDSNEENGSRYN